MEQQLYPLDGDVVKQLVSLEELSRARLIWLMNGGQLKKPTKTMSQCLREAKQELYTE